MNYFVLTHQFKKHNLINLSYSEISLKGPWLKVELIAQAHLPPDNLQKNLHLLGISIAVINHKLSMWDLLK